MITSQVILPSPALSFYVHHYWILRACDVRMSQLILPSGCMKWIFHRKKPFDVNGMGDFMTQISVCGQYERAIHIQSDENVEMLAVFFHPYAMQMIMGMPCHPFTNNNVDFDDIENKNFSELKNKIQDAPNSEACITLIESFIFCQLTKNQNAPYFYSLQKVFHEMYANPECRIETLAEIACLSERQFRRVFTENVGMSPKQLIRIQRFHLVTNSMMQLNSETFSALLDKYGYVDHSHFNHEFQHFTGMSPSSYLQFLEKNRKDGNMSVYRSYHML